MDLLDRQRRVDRHVPARVGGGAGPQRFLGGTVERMSGSFKPVGQRPRGRACEPGGRVDVEQHGQVSGQPAGCEGGQGSDLVGAELPAGALVGDGGVHVPVAQHGGAGRQSGGEDLVDVLGACGGVQQRFGARTDGPGRVEQQRAELLTKVGAARFAGRDGVDPGGAQPAVQQPDLG